MNRRKFMWTMATVTAGAGLFSREVGAQAGNPKVNLFGMIVIDDTSGLSAVFPQVAGMAPHRAFLAAPTAQIQALKGTPVSIVKSGIEQVHRDFRTARFPSAWCIANQPFSIGSGSASLHADLRKRLPSLSNLGSEPSIQRKLTASLPPGSFTLTLGGGTLRLPVQRSTSVGTDPNVLWQFYNGATTLGQPMSLTDMAVFESATPTLDISANGGTLTMKQGDVLWFFNLPLYREDDLDPMTIEHAAVPFSLLSPSLAKNDVTAKTKTKLVFPGANIPFTHPCIGGMKPPAAMTPGKKGGKVRIAYLPPDSDPCFMSIV